VSTVLFNPVAFRVKSVNGIDMAKRKERVDRIDLHIEPDLVEELDRIAKIERRSRTQQVIVSIMATVRAYPHAQEEVLAK
jgi:hypothetical protein